MIIEKYVRSANSSNLRDDEHHHATEVLAAVALSSDVGALFYRVKYALDATSYHALADKWREIVAKKAGLRTWPTHISAIKVADISLNYWINDICESCGGKGFELHSSGQFLSDIACRACKGSGKKAVTCDHRERDYVADMLGDLDGYVYSVGGAAMKKLREQMDF